MVTKNAVEVGSVDLPDIFGRVATRERQRRLHCRVPQPKQALAKVSDVRRARAVLPVSDAPDYRGAAVGDPVGVAEDAAADRVRGAVGDPVGVAEDAAADRVRGAVGDPVGVAEDAAADRVRGAVGGNVLITDRRGKSAERPGDSVRNSLIRAITIERHTAARRVDDFALQRRPGERGRSPIDNGYRRRTGRAQRHIARPEVQPSPRPLRRIDRRRKHHAPGVDRRERHALLVNRLKQIDEARPVVPGCGCPGRISGHVLQHVDRRAAAGVAGVERASARAGGGDVDRRYVVVLRRELAGIPDDGAHVILVDFVQARRQHARADDSNAHAGSGGRRRGAEVEHVGAHVHGRRRVEVVFRAVGAHVVEHRQRTAEVLVKVRGVDLRGALQQDHRFVRERQRPRVAPHAVRVCEQPPAQSDRGADEIVAGADLQIAARSVLEAEHSRRRRVAGDRDGEEARVRREVGVHQDGDLPVYHDAVPVGRHGSAAPCCRVAPGA